jgi:Zn finger protein HypA/HybF involved in hydrogenase expression
MAEKTWVWKSGQLVEGEPYTHKCKVCGQDYRDTSEDPFLCVDCENEYADWIEENGFVIGVFDVKGAPDVHKGTKWERMND